MQPGVRCLRLLSIRVGRRRHRQVDATQRQNVFTPKELKYDWKPGIKEKGEGGGVSLRPWTLDSDLHAGKDGENVMESRQSRKPASTDDDKNNNLVGEQHPSTPWLDKFERFPRRRK